MMNTNKFNRLMSRGALALAAGIGLLLPATQAKAQDNGNYQAPPVNNYGATESVNNVFNWQDVPQNQVVPIDRAVFDQGGYQLYDQAGETIIVPFQNNNLYVMKFAVSQNGTTYFVNDAGQAPVLYVPEGGYLENATVPGARWYPFNQRFRPSRPVFLGIAPSYSDFIDIGWYPNEACYGGYYGNVSFLEGGYFGPTLGLTFIFGGHHYHDWDGYRSYAQDYPAPYHVGYFDRNDYRIGGRPNTYRRDSFIGSNGQGFHPSQNGFGGSGSYPGSGRSGFNGGNRGTLNGGQSPFSSRPTFHGTTPRPGFGGTTSTRPGFGGTTAPRSGFGGTSSPRPGFGGTTTTRPGFGGGQAPRSGFSGTTSPRPGFGGTTAPRPSFGGGAQAPRPSFGGGGSRPGLGGGAQTPRSNGGGGQTPRPSSGGSQAPRPSSGGSQAPRPSSNGNGQAPRPNGR